jgi:ubiquinone/menaquinone biosynthesis C-methylase UbiE
VQRSVRLERIVIGLRGLALLRGWPLGDPAEADRQLDAIEALILRRREPPMSDVFDVTEFNHAAGYAAWAETYDDENNLIDMEERYLRQILERFPAGDAADIACGTGRVSALLGELGHRVTGVDPSEEMLAVARAKGTDATFLTGDFTSLPLESDSIDLVTCALALTHVADLRGPMVEMARIVRPGGRIVLSDIHPIAVATGGQGVFRRADGTRGVAINLQHWTSDYVAAFRHAGLAIEDCVEPLVDDDFISGLRLEPVRQAAGLALTRLPCLLLWVLTPADARARSSV